MITETKQSEITREHLVNLYKLMLENKDTKSAGKMLEITEKWMNQTFMISFTGHFSAGKSSIINDLLETPILPKSPIPTSANVVRISSGKGIARLYTDGGAVLEYEEPYDIDMIKDYATKKGTIKAIDISTKEPVLPEGCTIVDTPGIDAADDADRLITESSMHLADVLFYVMDYNHVQSEVNLQFLRNVQKHNIPIYIVINQIDKHNEEELTFDAFSRKINQTFDQWGLLPEKIYYSSLIAREFPYNQVDDLKRMVSQLLTDEKNHFFNVERSINQVVAEHKTFLQQEYDTEAVGTPFEWEKGTADTSGRLEELDAEMDRLNNLAVELEHDFRTTLNGTLNNAYLMPANLRDRAHAFLASKQQDFKIGLFSSKKKTAEARHQRETDFLTELQETIRTSIQWRLRDKLLTLLQSYGLNDQELLQQVQNMSLSYDANDLSSLIKPGATLNSGYVLQYTDDLSNDIKQNYKQEALKLLNSAKKEIVDNTKDKLAELESERADVAKVQKQHEMNEKLRHQLNEKLFKIDAALTDPEPNEEGWEEVKKALPSAKAVIKKQSASTETEEMSSVIRNEFKTAERQVAEENYQADHILSDLEKVIEIIDDLPGFGSIVDDLQHKYSRIDSREFTVALFGAFSAGKSSFANALIGEPVLPSAPNPTTAVINRIHPVTEGYEHGTVVVRMKDEITLMNDLKMLLHPFEPEEDNVSEMLEWVKKHNIQQNNQLEKTQQTYLNALLEGYADRKNEIGQEKKIDLSEFPSFVTTETIACYIESVDLYYDCALTRKGITLIDTPGADSINARHTDVAFEYIKYADAILYVTYYNHAFSRSDKNFLMQLGRVKDSFQLDKMFFIMNASDLAEDESELEMVRAYIKEHLTSLGIRFPRLFPVSSKQSLKEKQQQSSLNSQMRRFEAAFNSFIHNELTFMMVQSAITDISRAKQSISHFLNSMQMGEDEKERTRQRLTETRTVLKKLTNGFESDLYEQKLRQKLEKQLYFVLERFSIRFHDMFKETFNPATITDSGKKAKQQLKSSLRRLLDYTGYELLQELRAVSLRVESFMNEVKHDAVLDYTKKSGDIDPAFLLPHMEDTDLLTPDYEQAFLSLAVQTFEKELKAFNGTKAFFAKNEKEDMKERLFNRLLPYAEVYINENHTRMQTSYIQQWNTMTENMKLFVNAQIDSYIDNQLQMINDRSIDLGVLRQKEDNILSILANYEEMN